MVRAGVARKDLRSVQGYSAKHGWERMRVVMIWTDGAEPGGVASRVGTESSRD